ncbi:hypothetical protein SERLADRAFT_468966 [Serpula lacrymans var. lacrymans S7.9]|nr:uncharacterized protein SERLADRAFT_468966 [Serpula lacrymans var. lacrymans S7.9]EGO24959.1 hypothetical protein SERLADRAFT_468966 [Serpula lacrymans var. lacrymans S7.9]
MNVDPFTIHHIRTSHKSSLPEVLMDYVWAQECFDSSAQYPDVTQVSGSSLKASSQADDTLKKGAIFREMAYSGRRASYYLLLRLLLSRLPVVVRTMVLGLVDFLYGGYTHSSIWQQNRDRLLIILS